MYHDAWPKKGEKIEGVHGSSAANDTRNGDTYRANERRRRM
jgi:hypothetical protein